MNNRIPVLLTILLLSALNLSAQTVVRGIVLDAASEDPLIGANISIEGTARGTVTDFDGSFELKVDQFPVELTLSYLGYITKKEIVSDASESLTFTMEESEGITLAVTEVKAQRISDKQKASPLTVESMDILAIKETPSENFYDGLGSLKGVDLTAASLGFKVINTRGFNSTSPVRSLQLIDGVDNQSPGLNFSLGNFLGVPDLDILKVDLIVGASSAYYGPNAFNGVISMKTKDPFLQEGLAAELKMGERNLLKGSLRYAHAFTNKEGYKSVAFKLNGLIFSADDWEADNLDAVDDTDTDVSNPGGYDAVNVYGDEYQVANDLSRSLGNPGLGIFHRRGYQEDELVNYDADNFKINASLQFRLKPSLDLRSPKLIFSSNYSGGTTVYQGDNRFSLRDVKFYQHKVELAKEGTYFLRFYATHEDAGNSYDPYFTALLLQDRAKENGTWSKDYVNYWASSVNPLIRGMEGFPRAGDFVGRPDEFRSAQSQFLGGIRDQLIGWHQDAQAFANSVNPREPSNDFLEPGSQAFQNAFDEITSSISFAEGGTRFFDKSALFHAHGEYRFQLLPEEDENALEITTGGSGRIYSPNSMGSILLDTFGRNIDTWEFGVYGGAQYQTLQRKMIFNGSFRVDKHENFGVNFSPALSVVFKPAANNYARLSFSSAIRNPTLADQFLFYNVGRAILLGNIDGIQNLITVPSLGDYLNTLDDSTLDYFDVDPIRTEKVQTIEAGYKTLLFNSLYLDAEVYFSRYRDFIGFQIGVDAEFDPLIGLPQRLQAYRVASNAEQIVNTQGFSMGFNYYFRNYAFTGNYSWNKLVSQVDDPIIPAFNTPEHKFNLGFSGRDIIIGNSRSLVDKFGFNVSYKWIEGFLFEGSPQFTGFIPSYGLMDAQINFTSSKTNLNLKIGASNVLDNKVFQTYGGPRIGRLGYVALLYDFRKR
ncbi:MAG: TonB-dependent receptor [Saprospiraceae bacterium]|nr:TonB-dependent receptor [Saprospiraceae bacterium]